MTPRVLVVGLGPAGPDLLTAGTYAAIADHDQSYLRTTRHPAALAVTDATSFDRLYNELDSLEEVYKAIVEELVAAAKTHGKVLYAVPGSPLVAERTVELLLTDDRINVEVLPALSFLDLAWVSLGVDPIGVGARVIDGQRFATEAAGERGPLLVAQCDRQEILSDIKLAVDIPPEAPVTVLSRLGLADEAVYQVAWEDLDRTVVPDHLTSLWIPEMAAPIAGEIQQFVELVAKLRDECAWDQEQTHRSLAPYLLEESYEVLEVLDAMPDPEDDEDSGTRYDHLEEELGDLLYQICFHSQIATEAGQFTLADVARRIHDKLVSRHPQIFGDQADQVIDLDDPAAIEANWELAKKNEKGRTSAFEGIPAALPALSFAATIEAKAQRLGLDPLPLRDSSVGQRLVQIVLDARSEGIDPEAALRAAVSWRRELYLAAERDNQASVGHVADLPSSTFQQMRKRQR